MRVSLALRAILLLLAAALAPSASAHEGHDHDAPVATATASAPRGEAASGDFQLVAILRNETLVIYLDRLATNEPIVSAQIEAETPSGQHAATANPDGTFQIPAAWPKGADHYDLIFTVTADDKVEVMPLTVVGIQTAAPAAARSFAWPLALITMIFVAFAGGVFIARRFPQFLRTAVPVLSLAFAALGLDSTRAHDGHDHNDSKSLTANTGRDISQRLPDGTVFVPKSVQRLLTIRTTTIAAADHFKAVELPGRVIPDPNASGYVQSTLAGRLVPPPNGFPLLGSRVEKGQVLAYVTPPIQQIDISDMRQKEGEILQQIAIVERRVARFEKLSETGAVSRVQLDDARAELQGLRDRKTALDQIRREPEVLVAPVSGIIAEVNTIAGQLAQANTVVFQIVDPSRLWVEALSFDAVTGIEKATARNHAGKNVDLAYRGSGAALRNQSIPVHFAIEGTANGLSAGQFVTVFVTLPDKQKGILLPRSAVVRASNGQHVVFEHVSAERFEPRVVKIEVLDAQNVLVTGGIDDGKRVVVQGAELIDQVR
jgi:RND family efflux transporter MFP subunit